MYPWIESKNKLYKTKRAIGIKNLIIFFLNQETV